MRRITLDSSLSPFFFLLRINIRPLYPSFAPSLTPSLSGPLSYSPPPPTFPPPYTTIASPPLARPLPWFCLLLRAWFCPSYRCGSAPHSPPQVAPFSAALFLSVCHAQPSSEWRGGGLLLPTSLTAPLASSSCGC